MLPADKDKSALKSPESLHREAGHTAAAFQPHAMAGPAIGEITPGCQILVLTRGQFSFSHAIRHIIDATGPARLDISTWAANGADLKSAETLIRSGLVTKIRFVIDPSFKARQRKFCDALEKAFSPDCIRTIHSHAKFALIYNEKWSIAVRTSMNLNPNPRIEFLEISDSPDILQFFVDYVDDVFEIYKAENNFLSQSAGELDKITRRFVDKGPPFGVKPLGSFCGIKPLTP